MLQLFKQTQKSLFNIPLSNSLIQIKRFYDQKVIDHFENPRNVGTFDADELDIGTGLHGSLACGDVMKIQLKIDKKGIIEDARFKTYGCGSAIASSSFLTEQIKGKHIENALRINNKDIAKELNLPPQKLHCSLMAQQALKSAFLNWREKNQDHVCVSGENSTSKKLRELAKEDKEEEKLI
ncbi:iron-sulfur cluster assembly enzyme nifu [Anaeramoeba flamelloides]|uniref:Iron-sulfur cluster assembly enzyme nifu n=1 Tax=Anaeramoeba flamelloides TaxID=1746091 RepID=A0ABQ8YE53_9EUKA|nr:iron-sulfur cluster assembly enzyme nifu [Anaeramoeba flamelloides]